MNTATKSRLFLIEFYTCNPATGEGGWDINFAWVHGINECAAVSKLVAQQGFRFDCVIQIGEHADIQPLSGNFRINTPDANLFILS